MKKKIFFYVLVLLLSTLLLTGCTKKEEENIDEGSTDNQEEVVEEEEEQEEEQEEEPEDLGDLANPDDFTKVKQTLGEVSDFKYTIVSIQGDSGEGFYDFSFQMKSSEEGAVTPLFTVEPLLEKGVLRVTLKNVTVDTTGITFDKGITVNSGAITGLYRTVTSLTETRIYDIGIQSNNSFKLEQLQSEVGMWNFSLKVAYDTEYTAPTIDYGSTEFSSDMQDIEGVTSQEGSKILTYSYSSSGGVLKFVYSVASGASNPIPSVNAQYDESGLLVVTFESLSSDKVSTWGSNISLPAGVSTEVSRSGEVSVYKFGGISGKKPFKLSATQSPNQVIVEIKL